MNRPAPEEVDHVVIRFAGDSGDGMQLLGSQFTNTAALVGNDLSTLPDYPAEIRAPAGTREGVSGFQLQFAAHDIFTPGDECDVLVAMNAAALITNVARLRDNGLIVVNSDKFASLDLKKARLDYNPLEDDALLSKFTVVKAPISTLTKDAVTPHGLNVKQADRCKNFFALGMMYWLYDRKMNLTTTWVQSKFKSPYAEANLAAMHAGHAYAETVGLFQSRYEVPPAELAPATYRNVMGNAALAMGLAAAAVKSNLQLFYGSYPITPASDILHALAPYKNFGVLTYQAEDEIAAVCAAIGASYGGNLGVTGTSGPGLALKGEAIGLALMAEIPLVVINVQRGGPSTGLPTKTEQSDLMQAMYGRNGEGPVPIIAPSTPSDCFEVAFEACRIAMKYMVPVILLSDGYIANGSEPWSLPDIQGLPDIKPTFRTDPEGFEPYLRDEKTLARPWVRPGTPGLEHRIGGLEKEHLTGNVSYDPENHQFMCEMRAAKVKRIQQEMPPLEVYGDPDGVLVLGWGSTFGAIRTAVRDARAAGQKAAHVHLRWLNPLPADLAEVLNRYDKVLLPELNLGQLSELIRGKLFIDTIPFSKVQGQPFKVGEIRDRIEALSVGASA